MRVATLKSQIDELDARRQRLVAEQAALAHDVLPKLVQQLLDDHPALQKIIWTQREGEYDDEGPTPGVHLEEVVYAEITYCNHFEADGNTDQVGVIWRTMAQALRQYDTQALFSVFGSYSRIVASASGISAYGVY